MGNHMGNAIEQMKRKEEAGLSYLYSKTYNYVYLRAKNILKKEEDIQQLMKAVYVQAFESANRLKEEEMYEWLGKRVYTLGTQGFRKKKAREATCIELEKNDLVSRKNVNQEPTIEVICKVLEELPDLYQATFYAFYYDYMSVADIAEVMDCSIGTILNRLNYTAKYIKKAIEIYNEEEGKEKKAKAYFSLEAICVALRKWSVDHCLGMATAQTLYSNICKELKLSIGSIYLEGKEFAGVNNTVVYHKVDDMSALLEEIAFYEKKESIDKRKIAIIAGAAVAIVLLIIIGVAVFGGKEDKKEEKNPPKAEQGDEEADEPEVSEPEDDTQEENQQEDESEGNDSPVSSEYILPTSDTVKLTEADLASLTKEELRLARNEIYARHGMIFGVDDLDSYFATKSWYEPKYTSSQFYDSVEMSMIEEANINLILSVEKSR